jgi:hypothetical protein
MNASEINKIVGARTVEDHVLELTFSDGYVGRLDLAPALWGTPFEPLRNPVVFHSFRVEDETIRWPNGADFCPDVLRYWCEVGGVRSQQQTDAHFAEQLVREHTREVAEVATPIP